MELNNERFHSIRKVSIIVFKTPSSDFSMEGVSTPSHALRITTDKSSIREMHTLNNHRPY
jgi:hypothetical protein